LSDSKFDNFFTLSEDLASNHNQASHTGLPFLSINQVPSPCPVIEINANLSFKFIIFF